MSGRTDNGGCGGAACLLLLLLKVTTSAMVLPRPPSSPNHIRQEVSAARKLYGDGGGGKIAQSSNVERPYTEDYRLLEIELQSADDMDAANLQGLIHTVLKSQRGNESPAVKEEQPNPEVVPNSILGVRDVGGLTPSFRLSSFDNADSDKRVLLSPPKLQNLDEKLYYLKNGRPKVYVNVRGNSGTATAVAATAFRRKEMTILPRPPAGEQRIGFLGVTRPLNGRQDDPSRRRSYKKKAALARPPKKFDRRYHTVGIERSPVERKFLKDVEISSKTAEDVDPAITESSLVTSSELPKQIPAPPSDSSPAAGRISIVQTTPVQRYIFRRTDILPGYGFAEE